MWKKIENTNYSVSDLGEIKNDVSNKFVKSFVNPKGYCSVGLYINGKRERFRVHRLVAKHFFFNFDESFDVHHKNGIRHDNRLENLELMTSLENQRNKIFNGQPYIDGKLLISNIIDLYIKGLNQEDILIEMQKKFCRLI